MPIPEIQYDCNYGAFSNGNTVGTEKQTKQNKQRNKDVKAPCFPQRGKKGLEAREGLGCMKSLWQWDSCA